MEAVRPTDPARARRRGRQALRRRRTMASPSAPRHQPTPAVAVIPRGAPGPRPQHTASRRRRRVPATMLGVPRHPLTTRLPLVVWVLPPLARRSTLPLQARSMPQRRVRLMLPPRRPGQAAGAPTLRRLPRPGRRRRVRVEGTTARLRLWLTVVLRLRRRAARGTRTMIEPSETAGRYGSCDEVGFCSAGAFKGGGGAIWGDFVRERARYRHRDATVPYQT